MEVIVAGGRVVMLVGAADEEKMSRVLGAVGNQELREKVRVEVVEA